MVPGSSRASAHNRCFTKVLATVPQGCFAIALSPALTHASRNCIKNCFRDLLIMVALFNPRAISTKDGG